MREERGLNETVTAVRSETERKPDWAGVLSARHTGSSVCQEM